MPLHQQRTRNSIPPRRRRDRSRHPQTLQHNPELLVIRPAAAPTGLNHLEPLNLSTVLIDVHKDCYKSINKTKQGGRHRRETLNAALPPDIDGPGVLAAAGTFSPIVIGPELLAVQDRARRARFIVDARDAVVMS